MLPVYIFLFVVLVSSSANGLFLGEMRAAFPVDSVNGVELGYHIGLARDPINDIFFFIQHGPEGQDTYIVPAKITINPEALTVDVEPIEGKEPFLLLNNTQQKYSFDSVLPSSIVWEGEETFYWLNKQDETGMSRVEESLSNGEHKRSIPTPAYHSPDAQGTDQSRGVQKGRGYNGASAKFRDVGEPRLDVISEWPLKQDCQGTPSNTQSCPVRITWYSYLNDGGYDEISVADIENLGDTNGLVMETYHNSETGKWMAHIYLIRYVPEVEIGRGRGGIPTNVLGEESLLGLNYTPVRKSSAPVLVIDEEKIGGKSVEKLSYMVLAADLRTEIDAEVRLLVGSDNQNQPAPRFFQLLAFELERELIL